MKRFVIAGIACVGLAACQPSVPDNGANVLTSMEAQNQRDAALSTSPFTAPAPVADTPLASADPAAQPLPSSVTAAVTGTQPDPSETQAAIAAANANSGIAPIEPNPSNPAPAVVNSAGISTEQDFDAVAARRSIESDAQRVAANRAQYTLVTPTDLPTRPGSNQPNIVEYALRTNNPVGARLYRRVNLRSAGQSRAACARFASPDQAQIEFLSRGGPQRDRRGLDPDGDGFACSWDPTPFRLARQRAATGAGGQSLSTASQPLTALSE